MAMATMTVMTVMIVMTVMSVMAVMILMIVVTVVIAVVVAVVVAVMPPAMVVPVSRVVVMRPRWLNLLVVVVLSCWRSEAHFLFFFSSFFLFSCGRSLWFVIMCDEVVGTWLLA